MIEAVNSVVSNAQGLRGAVATADASSAVTAQIKAQEAAAAPRAPFISPYVAFDTNFDTAVLQIRDSATGDVLRQIPTEKSLELRQLVNARREAQAASQARLQEVVSTAPQTPAPQQSSAPAQAPTPAPTIQAQAQAVAPASTNTSAGAAQVAIAALSAGANAGQPASGQINVTA